MPIEFQCVGCGKLLRTPDESAGKKAKCPQCAAVVDIPRPAPLSDPHFPAPVAGGDSFPLAPNSSPPNGIPFGETPDANLNPYATPVFSPTGYAQPLPYNSAAPGLPWEQGPRSSKTFWQTAKLIFQQPTNAFRQMRPNGGFDRPLTYALVGNVFGATVCGMFIGLVQAGIALMGVPAADGPGNNVGIAAGIAVGMFVGHIIFFAIFGAMGAVLGTFVSGAINHFCLMIVGGAKQPFETTFRVCAYGSGTTALLQCIPICGLYFLVPIFSIIFSIIGLSTAHGISGGKAALAVFLPIVVCCGGVFLFYAAIIGLVLVNAPN